jgi:integrase
MPSSWIITRRTLGGSKRYLVRYRAGGRESRVSYGGSFPTQTEARARKRFIDGELAACRLPVLDIVSAAPPQAPVLREACTAWRATRIDVTEGTQVLHRVALDRVLTQLGADTGIDTITAETVAQMVAAMAKPANARPNGYTRETIRKSVTALAMVLDHHGIDPNPCRDRRVRLPREKTRDLVPPLADHVEAVASILPRQHVLPFLLLDATGCRLGEIAGVRAGDLDERRQAFLIRPSVSKTSRPRWVQLPDDLYAAVLAQVPPRDDRDPDAPLLMGFDADSLRTCITRACKATGVPHFSPHALRRRRGSLLQKQGRSLAEVSETLGDTKVIAAQHYLFALGDYREIDRAEAPERVS